MGLFSRHFFHDFHVWMTFYVSRLWSGRDHWCPWSSNRRSRSVARGRPGGGLPVGRFHQRSWVSSHLADCLIFLAVGNIVLINAASFSTWRTKGVGFPTFTRQSCVRNRSKDVNNESLPFAELLQFWRFTIMKEIWNGKRESTGVDLSKSERISKKWMMGRKNEGVQLCIFKCKERVENQKWRKPLFTLFELERYYSARSFVVYVIPQ